MRAMKIGILGLGNLGSSLLRGLLRSGAAPSDIMVCDIDESVRASAANEYKVRASADINDAVAFADTVFIVLKGYVFDELAPSVKCDLRGKTFVSFMAGVTFERIYGLLGEVELVRAMPSLAIAEQSGVVGYTKCSAELAELFGELGYAFEVAPEDIEKVMAFSACGLGFAAYMIDALSEAGQALGFTPEQADKIASLTFMNAGGRGGDYKTLVSAVAVKGGATERGVLHMDAENVYGIVETAVRKAYEKMI